MSTASATSSHSVRGAWPPFKAAIDSAANATSSPWGMKITFVTENTSTSAKAIIVDRAVDDAVLPEQQGYLQIHIFAPSHRSGTLFARTNASEPGAADPALPVRWRSPLGGGA